MRERAAFGSKNKHCKNLFADWCVCFTTRESGIKLLKLSHTLSQTNTKYYMAFTLFELKQIQKFVWSSFSFLFHFHFFWYYCKVDAMQKLFWINSVKQASKAGSRVVERGGAFCYRPLSTFVRSSAFFIVITFSVFLFLFFRFCFCFFLFLFPRLVLTIDRPSGDVSTEATTRGWGERTPGLCVWERERGIDPKMLWFRTTKRLEACTVVVCVYT